MDARRTFYRVKSDFSHETEVDLLIAGRAPEPVALININQGGARVAVYRSEHIHAKGAGVALRFSSEHLAEPLILPAHVRYVHQTEASVHYGIEFGTWTDARQTLHHRLRALFNERRAHRVAPPPGTHLPVVLSLGERRLERGVLMRDISILGMGLRTRGQVA